LLFLTNSARASTPAFVLKSVASWWSGAPLVIIAQCSAYARHSNCARMSGVLRCMGRWWALVCCVFGSIPQSPCTVRACVTTPNVCQLSVRNACDTVKDGGVRSAMAYCPIIGLLPYSLTHSSFMLSRLCWNRFANVVVSVAGSSSVASLAISSTLSFPAIPMFLGTHAASMCTCLCPKECC